MARVPLPLGFEGTEFLPETDRLLQNCFNNGNGRVISRPGILEIADTGLVARGNFVFNEKLYQVISTQLVQITNVTTGAFTVIGTIAGTNPIQTAVGFNDAVIVVPGSNTYMLSNSNILTSIVSVGDNSTVAKFNYSGDAIILDSTVDISGFVVNTAYNVTNTAVTATESAITSTVIASVADSVSTPGVASFTHAGTSPSLGSSVTITDFIVNTAYNATGIVTLTTATTFEVSTIAWGTNEAATGNYVTSANFSISSIVYGSDEAVGQFTTILTDITSQSNFEAWIDVCHINGRFIYIPFDGTPAKFSDVGEAESIQPLSFFDAEELPDKNNGCFNFGNVLYITGTDSIEQFRDSGATPNPWLRVNGARINNGFIGGQLEYNKTFLFIGREKDQDYGIYAIGQGDAPKISNETIDLKLSTYTIDELADAIPGRIKWRGYDIATFTLARDSFAFFGGNWFLLDTVFNDVSSPWGGGFIAQFEGSYYTAFGSKIGKFSNIHTDYGERLTRRIRTGFEQEDGDYLGAQKVELGISQGFNTADGSVALRVTRNGVDYSQPVYRNLGNIGQYGYKLLWQFPGGIGTQLGYVGLEFYTTENVDFSIEYLSVS